MYARVLRDRDARDAVWFKNTISALSLGLLALLLGPSLGGGAVAPAEAGWLALSGLSAVCVGDLLYFVAIAHIGVGRTDGKRLTDAQLKSTDSVDPDHVAVARCFRHCQIPQGITHLGACVLYQFF